MESYIGMDGFWDMNHNPSSFSTIGEDDFLALLQKQFPTNANPFDIAPPDGIDPLNLNNLSAQNPTPPSTDSSPSPPSTNQEPAMSRRHSGTFGSTSPTATESLDDPMLKRKASDEQMSDEPTMKTAHTDLNAGRKPSSGPHRRKSTGNPHQDELRLLKRKEQNRAAQRAFRERKEKHVKDLEDKVAALEAKNVAAESENDNLRDLLSRLQSENMALKQAAFTFQVPKPSNTAPTSFQSSTPGSFFSTPGASTSSSGATPPHMQQQQQPQQPQPFDFNFGSLIPFDPASLNMLDEPTATDSAMNMDFGLGQPNGMSPYKTIASNPMYMSIAEPTPYDLTPPPVHPIMQMQTSPAPSNNESATSPIDQALRMTPFDWTSNSPPSATATNGGNGVESLDHLFGVGFNGAQPPVDFSALLRSPPSSVSPVSHRSTSSPLSASSPASSMSTPMSSGTPGAFAAHPPGKSTDGCPRTKEDVSKMIQAQGQSSFVQDPPPALRAQTAFFSNGAANGNGDANGDSCPRMTKEALIASMRNQHQQQQQQTADDTVGPNGGFVRKMGDGTNSVVMCKGSSFPKTEKNDRNIEVLAAWRSITQNPQFKNVDINELCSEFTKKARCDGTKVVLEPEGVSDIIQSLAQRQ